MAAGRQRTDGAANTMISAWVRRWVAALAAMALIVAACTGPDDDTASTTTIDGTPSVDASVRDEPDEQPETIAAHDAAESATGSVADETANNAVGTAPGDAGQAQQESDASPDSDAGARSSDVDAQEDADTAVAPDDQHSNVGGSANEPDEASVTGDSNNPQTANESNEEPTNETNNPDTTNEPNEDPPTKPTTPTPPTNQTKKPTNETNNPDTTNEPNEGEKASSDDQEGQAVEAAASSTADDASTPRYVGFSRPIIHQRALSRQNDGNHRRSHIECSEGRHRFGRDDRCTDRNGPSFCRRSGPGPSGNLRHRKLRRRTRRSCSARIHHGSERRAASVHQQHHPNGSGDEENLRTERVRQNRRLRSASLE